jgi:FtsH-binding integral membrane protein
VQPDDQTHERNERDLARIVQFASAVSLGGTAAFLYSLKSVTPNLRLEFSLGTVVAFVVAAALSWFFWRFVFRLASTRQNRPGRSGAAWFATIAAALLVVTAAAFAYSVKDVGREKLGEVAIGAGAAILVLSFFGFIIWRVGRFFSEESDETSDSHH